ncbi:TonB-dependent siderophore receptor [Aliikangiella sp. G2MR2-5]|uniref:TonB-dependent receptor plug domain-containing protein n=1 Tax=Aliikangiella sp. G2MR2-5 TaxID=2788943 RepID=UPI0018ABC78D|nr:TonB-dependent receptor plug domain-containing protein [Aliikangiella sp. G2MR2-5]
MKKPLEMLLAAFLLSFGSSNASTNEPPTAADLIELQLEDLVSMEIEIETAGKKDTKALNLPYAAYVITKEDIREYQVQTIPEALRMAPGILVEQMGSREWGVSIRGAGGRFSRFVLVLVNGRSLNNTMFSGVNWDEINLSLNNIERIEVIRGPNAESWGANAVNGIVNIITSNPSELSTSRLSLTKSNDSSYRAELSLGQEIKNNWYHSIAINSHSVEGLQNRDMSLEENSTSSWRTQYHVEKVEKANRFSISFDKAFNESSNFWSVYSLPERDIELIDEEKNTEVIQLDWQHWKSDKTQIKTRVSAQNTSRDSLSYRWDSKNYQADVDFLHIYDQHQLGFGINFRRSIGVLATSDRLPIHIEPDRVEIDYSGIYFNGKFSIPDKNLTLVTAARLDHNSQTGYEFQPSMRLMWKASGKGRVWYALSQASTIPSAVVNGGSDDIFTYLTPQETGSPYPLVVFREEQIRNIDATRVTAQELGGRYVWEQAHIDVALYEFRYSNELAVIELGEPQISNWPPDESSFLTQRVELASNYNYKSHGAEIRFLARFNPSWDFELAYSFNDVDEEGIYGAKNLASIRSQYRITEDFSVALWFRHSSGNEVLATDKSDTYDFIFSYQLMNQLKIFYTAKNIGEERYLNGIREFFTHEYLYLEENHLLAVEWVF